MMVRDLFVASGANASDANASDASDANASDANGANASDASECANLRRRRSSLRQGKPPLPQ
jgi:hypothetical protein